MDIAASPPVGIGRTGQHTPRSPALTEGELKVKRAKIAATSTVGAVLLGAAFKDGLDKGIERVGNISNSFSEIISLPISLAFPSMLLKEEYDLLRDGKKNSDNAALVLYPLISLAFMPKTFGEPLLEALKSPAHKVATLANLPHMLFSLFSYSGGRCMQLVKFFEQRMNAGSPEKAYRAEQERQAFKRLGNLGSNQCSIIPLASQCVTGINIISNVVKGNFSDALEIFKAQPIAATLGTLFNSWTFFPDYFSKTLDTIKRTCEMAPHFKYAIGGDSSFITRLLKGTNEWWDSKVRNKSSFLGKFFKVGRDISKMEAMLIPPLGMMGIVTTMFDRYFNGNFFNKEAQEEGGFIAFMDKIFCTGAFGLHMFYTNAYTFVTRLPQIINSSIFFGVSAYNRFAKGIDMNVEGYEKKEGYVDPNDIRNKVFNRSWLKNISNWSARMINDIENTLNPDSPTIMTEDENGNLTKNCKMIGDFYNEIARNEVFIPLKEELYEQTVLTECHDDWLEKPDNTLGRMKAYGEKPSKKLWANILENNRDEFMKKAEAMIRAYLEQAENFEKDQEDRFINEKFALIKNELDGMIKGEIDSCRAEATVPKTRKLVEKSDSFWKLLLHPGEFWEVLKLRSFHSFFSLLMLSTQNFVKAVDFGKKGELFYLRKQAATYTSINIGDIRLACDYELMPVYTHTLETAWKGAAKVKKAINYFTAA